MKNIFLSFSCIGFLLVLQSVSASRLDVAIDLNNPDWIPVFVRMDKQLVNRSGDFERICIDRARFSRSQNRLEVSTILREQAIHSWKGIEKFITKSISRKQIREVNRFWIVNGFSCLAQSGAVQKLASRSDVSFVYFNRFFRPFRKSSPMSAKQLQAMHDMVDVRRRKSTRFSGSLRIPWNVREIGAQAAWKEENATGQGVKVAVIDTGIISTPSLIHALVKNPGEELNGLDDDGNRLIDDLFGYDFIAGNGNILDSASTTSHGSSCVGIIAGQPSMSGLQTAIAPDSRIMLLKGGFNLRSLEYLITNGADIVSMSFMIVNRDLGQIRGLFRNAFEHLSLCGVLAVGGAGNYGPKSRRAMPVGKQIGLPKDIPCVLAIAGVDRSRIKLPFSSEGPCYWEGVRFFSDYPKSNSLSKPDLTAFPSGYPVWNISGSHKIRNDWKEVEREEGGSLIIGPAGNSFSGPHAAGVAALMLSVNPKLNPWEVSGILRETASDLGVKGVDSKFGYGLIDALAAVRAAMIRN